MAETARDRPPAPDEREIEGILEACERALTARTRADLRALRFWAAVDAVKRHPAWTSRFARRIAEIDRRAFLARTRPVFPLRLGVALLALGTVGGIGLLVAAFLLEPAAAGIAVLVGTGALIGTTHDLAHLLVGQLVGIRFTH